jgi:hypothetical protein
MTWIKTNLLLRSRSAFITSFQSHACNGKVIRLVEYVRGSQMDKCHWCKNCTQYPMYIYQKTAVEPLSALCDQCKTKCENGNCQCEELTKTIPEHELKSVFPNFCYNVS